MNQPKNLISYQKLLETLNVDKSANHLLLGNGFNNSLGVVTTYKNIFNKMEQAYPQYERVKSNLEEKNYDIELLIKELKESLAEANFLPDYIENKIKLDFMTATYSIVSRDIKKIYQEKNKAIHLLFNNFSNYFTLNYDPLLYLLLMQFKHEDENKSLVFQNTSSFIEGDLDTRKQNIYQKIKKAREEGYLKISDGDRDSQFSLEETSKGNFKLAVKEFFKNEKWKQKDIEEIINKIIGEENPSEDKLLKADDGFRKLKQRSLFKESKEQNIFFLHGAFHIYEKGEDTVKITQKQNKAFLQKLEEIIYREGNNILCILTGTAEDKKRQIERQHYLNICFGKLKTLKGRLVILGSSLEKNDQHIFNEINNSAITHLYIGTSEREKLSTIEKAGKAFKNKTIGYFDYESISYANNSHSN